MTKTGFLICPICRQRTTQRIEPGTVAEHLPLWCGRCKHETMIKINRDACAEKESGPR